MKINLKAIKDKFVKSNGIIYLMLTLAVGSAFLGGMNFNKIQKWSAIAYSNSLQNTKDISKNHNEVVKTKVQVAQTNIQVAKTKVQVEQTNDKVDKLAKATISLKHSEISSHAKKEIKDEIDKDQADIVNLRKELAILRAEIAHKKRPLL